MEVKIKKVRPGALPLTLGTEGSACFDIAAPCGDADNIEGWTVGANETTFIPTGWAFEIPEGHVMLMFSRSGHSAYQLRLANCVGVIDSDYRGEVKVPMAYDGKSVPGRFVHSGERIAQAMVIPVERVQFLEVDELSETARGLGGFGSTGR